MSPIEIRGFDPNRLEELAKEQTAIYNAAIAKFPNTTPADVENVIQRFKRDTFDQSRMFYAYDGDTMVGYAGLTGRDQEQNERGIGYPWLAEGTDLSVRDLLYEAMIKKCKDEGTQRLRGFGAPDFAEISDYFKAKGFKVVQEYLVHAKELVKNEIQLPSGYEIRNLEREDLEAVEEVSKNDPKMKSPFDASQYAQFMENTNYIPENSIVAEKDGEIVGYHAIFTPPDPKIKKAYFGGIAVHGDHQAIEPLLVKEGENRALEQGKETIDMTFYPDSPRLEPFRELGYKQYSHSFRLELEL
jgi:L-amino acid N-acyltransferase YncA